MDANVNSTDDQLSDQSGQTKSVLSWLGKKNVYLCHQASQGENYITLIIGINITAIKKDKKIQVE